MDDEPVIRDLVRQVLVEVPPDDPTAVAAEITEAATVAEAEAAWESGEPFDVALVDKNLPDGSGLELIARLKQRQPDAEAILVTAYPSFDSAVAALRCGAYDYMTKPFGDLTELKIKVRNAAEHRWLQLSRGMLSRELNDAVTSRMAAERERRDLEAELTRSHKMEALGRLAGGIAHDFNNLLVPILNYGDFMLRALDRLEEDLDDGERRRVLARIRDYCRDVSEAGQSAARLSRQLLSFSRDQVVAPQVLSVNDVACTVERLIRRSGQEHIEIETDLEEELWPIEAERSQLEQLLMNLCVNACEAMSSGGTLTICTENAAVAPEEAAALALRTGRYIRMSVADTGPGIPAGILRHIYEPFFTTKEEESGTGLGLATAYRIAEQHGGKLHVWSEVDHGTRFHIYLPVTDKPARASTAPPRSLEAESGGGETILVVEDEGGVRRLIRRVLESAGYRVLEASQGEEGWELYQAHQREIDLVLTDVLMPKLRGNELVDRIRTIDHRVAVVYMSAFALDTLVRHRLAGERVTLVAKPFDDDQLLAVLRGALDAAGRPVK